jgi:hypothetical protein
VICCDGRVRNAFTYVFLSVLVAFPNAAIACSCAANLADGMPHPHTVRQWDEAYVAGYDRSKSATIFEGTVEKQEIVSSPPMSGPFGYMHRLVTIRALRVYRGPSEERFVVRTGMGGGDCGFDFETGEQYLVFAERDGNESADLSTNHCSQTGPLQDSGPMLRVLRDEAPTPEDLLDQDTYYKRLRDPARWGSICGLVSSSNGTPMGNSWVYLERERHDGMRPQTRTELSKQDGTYCFEFLRPGTYFLSGGNNYPYAESRLTGSLSKNWRPLPISVEEGKTVTHMNLVLSESFWWWAHQHALSGIVIAISVTLALIIFWMVRRKTRLAS